MRVLIIPLLFLLSSCGQVLQYGITQKFKLVQGEKEEKLRQSIVDVYEKILNPKTMDVPLNKLVKGDSYQIYFAVSLQKSPEDLKAKYEKLESVEILEKAESTDGAELLMVANRLYYYSYIYSSDRDKLTYLLTLESDSSIATSKFKSHYLQDRVNEK